MPVRSALVLVLAVGLLVPVGIAQALDEAGDPPTPVVIDGAGKFTARGLGHVEIDGAGWAKVEMRGHVTITTGNDAVVKIRSFGKEFEKTSGATTIDLERFAGVVVIRGSDFQISARGKFRSIAAKGEGTAFLQGRGWYRATGGYFGTWTGPGVTVQYSL